MVCLYIARKKNMYHLHLYFVYKIDIFLLYRLTFSCSIEQIDVLILFIENNRDVKCILKLYIMCNLLI